MNRPEHITIGLVEDNAINRNTFLQKMDQLKDCTLLFAATNGDECLRELKGLPVNKLPKVLFVDLEMPVMNGIETIALVRSLYPEIFCIVLTVFDDDEKIFEAIKAGASGYLLKHESANFIDEAITNVLESGGAPMSPAIARKALNLLSKTFLNENDNNKNTGQPIPSVITTREEEILKYIVNGWDAKRIASVLNISVLTIRKHVANVYEKLHVQSKAQVISLAHKYKWFTES